MFFGFVHPAYLFLLIIIPCIILAYYLVKFSHKNTQGIIHANPYVLDRIITTNVRKHDSLTFGLALCACVALIFALAGPLGTNKQSTRRAIIVLVIDTSLSMDCTDVKPSRIVAAKIAAKKFIDELDPNINVGLVSFNSGANIESVPTTDHKKLREKIDALELNAYTATGEGIHTALRLISEFNEQFGEGETSQGEIILESDGKETVPVFPDLPGGEYIRAREAKQKGIPIHTISFGTPDGVVTIEGNTQKVGVDDESLAEVARLSGGKSFTAHNMNELKSVYSSLSRDISFTQARSAQPTWMLLIAILSTSGAVLMSILWGLRKKDLVPVPVSRLSSGIPARFPQETAFSPQPGFVMPTDTAINIRK